jgi:peptidoglycan/LPS O-acetylase OafA/YrhL
MRSFGNIVTGDKVGPSRLDTLTGLRFVAAFAVFLFHAVGQFSEGPVRDLLSLISRQGFVGVSFFFLLSGFVLRWSHRDGDTMSAFYRRRFARIAPAYWVALVVATVFLVLVSDTPKVENLALSFPSVLGIQAWFPMSNVHFAGNGVGWSLSAEMFFYALFPILLMMIRGKRALVWAGALAITMIVVFPVVLHPTSGDGTAYWAIYIFPAQRVAEFYCGVLLATAMRSGWRFPIGLFPASFIAIVAYCLAGFTPVWATVAIVTLVPFLLLIGAAAQHDLDGRASTLGRRLPMLLGEWSFSFYLVHQVVIFFIFAVLERLLPSPSAAYVALGASFAASIMGAAALYYWVEKPFEKVLREARQRPALV